MNLLLRLMPLLLGALVAVVLSSMTSFGRALPHYDGGKKQRPNSPYCGGPMCSGITADKKELVLGETSELHANASEPTGSLLTYAWKADAGSIVGEGSTVTYFAPTDKPGDYVVTVYVTDSHGHKVDCGITLTVTARKELASGIHHGVQLARATERAQRRLTDTFTAVARVR